MADTSLRSRRPGVIYARSDTDAVGHPKGGVFVGVGCTISWQDGPLSVTEGQRNGAFVEDVIEAAIARLEYYQRSPFACDYNERALQQLRGALAELDARTANRVARGVEGKHAE